MFLSRLWKSTAATILVCASAPSCSRESAKLQAGIDQRAAELKLLALPRLNDPNVPVAVFVHSTASKIMIATPRSGISIYISGREAGTTPCEIETRALLTPGASDPTISYPIEFIENGQRREPRRFALRFENANLNINVSQAELPEPLPGRDLWCFVAFDDSKSQESAPARK
ncbi:MAG: hypothetical protein HY286_14595 [Planctomycetes bacterium]|nr:hypothetical protein [Planctomycetota bacterium]